jgi:hypothetical protein
VRKHRRNLKRAGLRPIQIWVPDTRNPKFAEECKRQSQIIADSQREKEIINWLDRVRDTKGWE